MGGFNFFKCFILSNVLVMTGEITPLDSVLLFHYVIQPEASLHSVKGNFGAAFSFTFFLSLKINNLFIYLKLQR